MAAQCSLGALPAPAAHADETLADRADEERAFDESSDAERSSSGAESHATQLLKRKSATSEPPDSLPHSEVKPP